MDEDQIRNIVNSRESVDREFKSELHRLQTEDEIVSDIVAMANTNGGVLLLWVEDDGTITGTPERTGPQSHPAKSKVKLTDELIRILEGVRVMAVVT